MYVNEGRLASILFEFKTNGIQPVIKYVGNHKDLFDTYDKYMKMFEVYANNHHSINPYKLDFNTYLIQKLIAHACMNNNTLIMEDETNDIDRITTSRNVYKTYHTYKKQSTDLLKKDIQYYKEQNTLLNIKIVSDGDMYQNLKPERVARYDYAIDILKENKQDIGAVIFATHNRESFEKIKDFPHENCYHACAFGYNEQIKWQGRITKMVTIPVSPFRNSFQYSLKRTFNNTWYGSIPNEAHQ